MSSSYQVLARRFRPVDFDDVVGQREVLATLRGCLESERLPHAFLFCGSRGVGKTTTARILARAVNCEQSPGPQPCGECFACKAVLDGTASDVIELDAASNNGVDEVRALREQAGYAPIKLRKKVFILDEVHMFSRAAFNALLKILEEPPDHVVFILATTETHKVPETVRSRCQVLPFRRILASDIEGRLRRICEREGVTCAPEVLREIAAAAMGGLRDAETALERVLPLADGLDLEQYRRLVGRLGLSRAAEMVGACLGADARAALQFATEAAETGVDERECLGEVLGVLRQVFLLLVDGPESVLVEASGEWRDTLAALAERADLERIDAMMQIVILARERIRQMDDRRVLLELTLVRLARLGDLLSLGELDRGDAGGELPPAPAPVPDTPAAGSAPQGTPRSTASAPPQARSSDPWVQTVETALAEREALGALLASANLQWEGPSKLRLKWPPLKAIEQTLLSSEQTATYLAATLRRFAGEPVEIAIEVAPEGPAPAAPPPPDTGAEVGTGELPPLGKAAADLFDVQHVERDLPDGGPEQS